MQTYVFESVADPMLPHNWGVFMVAYPDDIEWSWHSHVIQGGPLLFEQLGRTMGHAWVMDLRTGEGAWLSMRGDSRAELEQHRIRVSAQFEAFLEWLYAQDLAQLYTLPQVVKVADATFSVKEYRRLGPSPVSFTLRKGDMIDIMWGGEIRPVTCDATTEEGAAIRDLTEAERLVLYGPDDAEDGDERDGEDVEGDTGEPHELDYEEMREGLPPPGAEDTASIEPPGAQVRALPSPDEREQRHQRKPSRP
jgi:hypothetical protein